MTNLSGCFLLAKGIVHFYSCLLHGGKSPESRWHHLVLSMEAVHDADSYKIAQCLQWCGSVHREPLISRLSMNALRMLRGLCLFNSCLRDMTLR